MNEASWIMGAPQDFVYGAVEASGDAKDVEYSASPHASAVWVLEHAGVDLTDSQRPQAADSQPVLRKPALTPLIVSSITERNSAAWAASGSPAAAFCARSRRIIST